MRQAYRVLLLFALVLSLVLVIVNQRNRDIHRRNPPSRFFPTEPPGKRFKPRLSQPY